MSPPPDPVVVVLPGPPRELRPMWAAACETELFRLATRGATPYRQAIMRLIGMPESEIADTLLVAEREGLDLTPLEITTCLRRGEIEIATRYEPDAAGVYEAFALFVRSRHRPQLFSEDGSTIDDQIAALLSGPPLRTVAVAESCTGGLLAGRLTDRPGSSAYVLGGAVVYSNEAKVALAGVDPELLARVGAVSPEVADALADGALARFGADVGIGVTGIAGPGVARRKSPSGRVYVSVVERDGGRVAREARPAGWPRRRARSHDDARAAHAAPPAARRARRSRLRSGADARCSVRRIAPSSGRTNQNVRSTRFRPMAGVPSFPHDVS